MIILALIIYFTANFLIARSALKAIPYAIHINAIIYWIIVSAASICPIAALVLKQSLPHAAVKAISWIGYYYLAAFCYLAMLFPIGFIISRLFKVRYAFMCRLSIILTALILCFGSYMAQSSYIKKYDISIDKPLKDGGLNIVMVSDIHLGDMIGKSRLDKMVYEINNLNPDIVVIAGDLVDGDLNTVIEDDMLSSLSHINAGYGTYFAFGNHDAYTGRSDELRSLLESNGVTVLSDESICINDSLYIIGRSCSSMKNDSVPLDDITGNLDNDKARILINHIPDDIDSAVRCGIDLQLSGHTHKGQFFPGNLFTHAIFPIDYGYKKFEDTNVIVSSGYGTWGPPIRIGSRSEIVKVNISGR